MVSFWQEEGKEKDVWREGKERKRETRQGKMSLFIYRHTHTHTHIHTESKCKINNKSKFPDLDDISCSS